MTIRIRAICDQCGETADLLEQRISEARAELYCEGWRSMRAAAQEPLSDFCPECVTRLGVVRLRRRA